MRRCSDYRDGKVEQKMKGVAGKLLGGQPGVWVSGIPETLQSLTTRKSYGGLDSVLCPVKYQML